MAFVVYGVGFGLLIVYTYRFPRYWRNELDVRSFRPEHMPTYWGLGQALWEGYARLGGVALVAMWSLIPAAVCTTLAHGRQSSAYYVAAQIIGTPFLLAIPVGAMVVLFNRPKILVFPRLRDRPGAVAMWRSSIRTN